MSSKHKGIVKVVTSKKIIIITDFVIWWCISRSKFSTKIYFGDFCNGCPVFVTPSLTVALFWYMSSLIWGFGFYNQYVQKIKDKFTYCTLSLLTMYPTISARLLSTKMYFAVLQGCCFFVVFFFIFIFQHLFWNMSSSNGGFWFYNQ